ncbi:unnamed protein product, partial [Nesidiocoris tenuis]
QSAPRQKIIDMSNTAAPTGSDCEMRTPCAWGVYVPFTRQFDYYMKNTCKCPKGTDCTRMDDDISVSAYIYRCIKWDPNNTQIYHDPYSVFPIKLPDHVTRST